MNLSFYCNWRVFRCHQFILVLSVLIRLLKLIQCSSTPTDAASGDDSPSHSTTATEPPESFVIFEYPEFDYIETPKNEIAWKEWVAACEQTPICLGRVDLDKLKCVRKCISRSCYQEIYGFNELEEGEIDVRAMPFKGCFMQRIQKKRHWD